MSDMPNKAGVCPKCGSENLDYEELEFGNFSNTIFYPFTCNKCGCEGREWYELEYTGTTLIEEDE